MRFIEKKFLYIIKFFLFVHIFYAQTNFNPQILLSQEKNKKKTHSFYAFENTSITFNEITTENQWKQLWKYQFLNSKNIELIAAQIGDISGNGNEELVVTTYSFGENAEIYIFDTENNVPVGTPEIYTLPNLKKGTKPTQMGLLAWDLDKDKEIVLSVSSPERKILILDYAINKLIPLESIAQEFMLNTYGPTEFIIVDYNQDTVDDIIILNNSEQPTTHTIVSNQSSFNSPTNIMGKLQSFDIIQLENQPVAIGLTQGGEATFLLDKINQSDTSKFDKILGSHKNQIVLLSNLNNIMQASVIDNNQLVVHSTQTSPLKNKNQTQSISNLDKTLVLLTNNSPKQAALISLLDPPTITELNYIQHTPQPKNNENIFENQQPTTRQETLTTKTTPTQITIDKTLYDTLYTNINENLEIDIEGDYNIHSVETINRPDGIILDPKSLKFIWTPTIQQTGIHLLNYNLTYNLEPVLETNFTEDEQLSLNSIVDQKQEQREYIIFVNDKPEIYFDIIQDTVRPPINLITDYTIIDKYFRKKTKLALLGSKHSQVTISDKNIMWELTTAQAGNNKIYFSVDDGMLADTAAIEVYVDTTSQNIIYDQELTATIGKEFIYTLPIANQKQTYNIIKAPNNLRLSNTGTIHWIPIIPQLDMNEIIIEILTHNSRETHTLNIYVNFPPLISYRPAIQEHITQGDTFKFNLHSFDMNVDAKLTWNSNLIYNKDTINIVDSSGLIELATQGLIDNQYYNLILSDQINEDIFTGVLYVNDAPKIISKPIDYLPLGDTLQYTVIAIDKNTETPFLPNETNQLIYRLENYPKGATINKQGQILWVPTNDQIGQNNFNIQVSDSIAAVSQTFSVFVNDMPNIVSEDSLSIQVGDTLLHLFGVQDLNSNTDLIYNIKTTINELMFSGKQGKLTWVPTIDELGLHTLEIEVSDGFNLSEDTQKLKIFVYDLPKLLNEPPKEAFINIPYIYSPKGKDMFADTIYNIDIFTNITSQDSLWTGKHNLQTNQVDWTPTTKDPASQTLIISIIDKYGHKNQEEFNVNLLISPCEKTDSLNCGEIDTIYIEKEQPLQKNKEKHWRPKTFSPFSN